MVLANVRFSSICPAASTRAADASQSGNIRGWAKRGPTGGCCGWRGVCWHVAHISYWGGKPEHNRIEKSTRAMKAEVKLWCSHCGGAESYVVEIDDDLIVIAGRGEGGGSRKRANFVATEVQVAVEELALEILAHQPSSCRAWVEKFGPKDEGLVLSGV